MFEKVKYKRAIGFGLVHGRERIENGGGTISQAVYDESVDALSHSEIVAHAVQSIKALIPIYGKGAAPYLAAALQFAIQYWIYEPFMVMPVQRERALLMNTASMFAVAQAGIGEDWKSHAQEILATAKEHVGKLTADQQKEAQVLIDAAKKMENRQLDH